METPLKIISLSTSDLNGGAARAAYRIHNTVRALGVNSRMLVKNKVSEDVNVYWIEDFDKKGFFSPFFRYIQHKIKNKLQHARWRKYPNKEDVFLSDLRSTSIHGALLKIDYDILHLHWMNLRFLDLRELQRINKPIVWTLHDCWPFTGICHYFYDCNKYTSNCGNCPFLHSGKEKDLSYTIWKRKLKLYKGLDLHIVTPSRWLADAAHSSSLFHNFPVTVIPNPIDTKLFEPGDRIEACKSLLLDADKTYILYGAMNAINDKRKGFQELIEAIRYFPANYNSDTLSLLIVGAGKPQEELNVQLPVHYLGLIESDEKMISAYRAASVMVVPSLSENLSNTIMESLSCGTPVVAFNIGGNGDMIEHKINGYLAKAISSEDLAQGVLWCLENNKDNHLSSNARRKVEENYTIEMIAGKYMELYYSL